IIALISIFKSGNVYLPLDQHASEDRLVGALTESGAKIIITSENNRVLLERIQANHKLSLKLILLDEFVDSSHNSQIVLSEWGTDKYEQAIIKSDSLQRSNPDVQFTPDTTAYIFFTSGSTGKPKGIKGVHKSLSHYIHWHKSEWDINEESSVCQLAPLTFDASLKDIFPALIAGAKLCIVPESIRGNVGELVNWLQDNKITHLQTVPSIFRLITKSLNENNIVLKSLQQVVLAGEKLYGQDIHEWKSSQNGSSAKLANMYGLTETTILKTRFNTENWQGEPGEVIPVGTAIGNTMIAVINDDRLCTNGEIGEVYIKSPFVTAGYLEENLNESLFVQNPLNNEKDIICRTGDLGRMKSDGDLEILGRNDEQVKIHGVRVELEGVRTMLYKIEGIKEVELVIYQNDNLNNELLCYYTGTELEADSLRKMLSQSLPTSHLPSHNIWLEEFPLNLNGKVDRQALPRPDQIVGSASFEPPQGVVEERLAELWRKVLGRKEISRNDSFFAIGGSSLKVIQLISWIYKEHEVQLVINDIFEHPELRSQALLIEQSRHAEYFPISKTQDRDLYVLSPAQLRHWLLEQHENEALPFNSLSLLKFTGDLNYEVLNKAFETLVARHETLRTIFIQKGGTPYQRVLSLEESGFTIRREDLRGVESPEAEARQRAREVRLTPFKLDKEPMIRVSIYQLSEDEHVLMIAAHHIIIDEWSVHLMARELGALYNAYLHGESNPLTALPVQYRDYTEWLQNRLAGSETDAHRSYWLDRFSGPFPTLDLATDYKRPEVRSFRGAEYRSQVPADQLVKLNALTKEHGATLFMGLYAVLTALLYRYTGKRDIVIGTPVAGRDHPDLENLIGVFLNVLALRTRFEEQESFAGLLSRIRQTTLEGFEHQMYPFDHLL
ncbi:MAG: condensation domain-containing protein, partial [Cyclobacteriaceae bacterium]